MPNYDLSTPAAIAEAAKKVEAERQKLHDEGDRSGVYDTHRTAFLHAYGQALQDCAKQLERFQCMFDIVLNYLGERYNSSELYEMLHEGMDLTNDEIADLGFDLPQLDARFGGEDCVNSKFVIVNGIEVDLALYLEDEDLIRRLMADEEFKSDVSYWFEKEFAMADDDISGDEILSAVVSTEIEHYKQRYQDLSLDAQINAASSRTTVPDASAPDRPYEI